MTGRVRALTLCAAAVLLLGPLDPGDAAARKSKSQLGEVIKASRLLYSERVPEARPIIQELVKRAPKAPEVRWLAAELAFFDGDYAGAIQQLDGLDDGDVDGRVGQTRGLASSTLAVTKDFIHKTSSGGHFEIWYADGPDEVIVDLAGDALEAAYREVGADLGWTPSEPVRVELLGKPVDLAAMSPLTQQDIETTGTIALSKYGKLMVVSPRATLTGYAWMDTLDHEYTHLVVSGLSHDTVPVWLQEGLARFEQERWRKPGGASLPPAEQQLLATAIKGRRLIELDAMHPSMAKLPSQEAAALAYAEVLTLVTWIHGKVGWEGLRRVIALQKDGKSAPRAVAEVLELKWPKVQRAWKSYLRGLDLSAGKPLAGRAGKRIRFDKGGEASENVGVDEVASAKARKFARLGGMLRARGHLDAAAIEYEKALAAAGTEPYVAGKLARTYVELGEYDKAIELARPLATLDEQDPVAAVTLGVALAAKGDDAGARDAFEQALRISPFDPAVRCGLADAYHHLGDGRADRERAACERLRS
ncbi:MAG: tetratricopeptide repeat protein [Kofleriaceae bacterium]|nr:tetratricopeptide repeat protein [Myxococcales bacterium]MCB9562106.1 tetratricopeptide repeat protein [Kofleriaceae bacterium]